MIADPYLLHHIVTANSEIAAALENLFSDQPDYDDIHASLCEIASKLEALIVKEVTR